MEKEGALYLDKIEVEHFVSTDQFVLRLLVVYLLVMGGIQVIFVVKEVLFITMPIIVWFGSKKKSL